ncbi:hypothetical protein YC2023_034535 [Brassica napus]
MAPQTMKTSLQSYEIRIPYLQAPPTCGDPRLERLKWMKISSLDELKTEVGHVYCYDSSSEDVRSKMYRVSLSLTPRAGGWEQRAVVGKLCGQHAYLFGSSLWAPLISLTWKFFHLPITIVAFGRTVRSIKL